MLGESMVPGENAAQLPMSTSNDNFNCCWRVIMFSFIIILRPRVSSLGLILYTKFQTFYGRKIYWPKKHGNLAAVDILVTIRQKYFRSGEEMKH